MSKIVWDATGEKFGETGVQWGVLFPFKNGAYTAGVAWNGLTSVNESPTGAEATPFYADNKKYIEIASEEEFAGAIGCYMYPDEFKACIGEKELTDGIVIGQQAREICGLVYRTEIASDTDGINHGYKIHIVYNARFGVSEREHTTINESPELEEMSFDFTTTKVNVTGSKPTAHLVIDSTKIPTGSAANFQTLLDTLFGKDGTGEPATGAIVPTFLMPDAVVAILDPPAGG